ncbi:MAG: hypothetical protein NXY57DRAFT_1006712 [Lentinula lateritia]|nr:MAG: hypothetical protein NXY57DRAFT_1006712 [Lentinula lateritia]
MLALTLATLILAPFCNSLLNYNLMEYSTDRSSVYSLRPKIAFFQQTVKSSCRMSDTSFIEVQRYFRYIKPLKSSQL